MSATTTIPEPPAHERASRYELDVEQREAYEYWGYLFKPDKTGTDKLKGLLRGLKDVVNKTYEPSDNPDLTPNQLAHFYRELHGNYDQLFLGTPSESIAFIYKSLGCLHSLQPQAFTQTTAFTDPTVPALKTEGWIMWQTIQLLLGPDEHSSFLSEAVQKWNVKDPETGVPFPKVLPRQCFPLEPDKHMVQWYEGVSERLRKEAEDEGRQREIEAEQAEVRRLHDRVRREDTDDEGSVDSRGPALAYFRNPLYRHVDGRPSIVRKNSKRPGMSPRPSTVVEKGKEAAGTFGHIVRNIGSPNLWNGKGGGSSGESRERDKDRDRRRRSLPDHEHRHQHRRRTPPGGRTVDGTGDDEWDDEAASPAYSPHPGSVSRHANDDPHDSSLRHTRSHEPTPTQKEGSDYFTGYENSEFNRRRSSAFEQGTPPSSGGAVVPAGRARPGTGFMPTASPLFATQLARQPHMVPARGPPPDRQDVPHRSPTARRTQARPYSHSPDPAHRPDRREEHHRREESRGHHSHHSSSRHRYEQSPAPYDEDYDDGPPRHAGHGASGRTSSGAIDQYGSMAPPGGGQAGSGHHRHGSRRSGSDVSYSGQEEWEGKRQSRPKQTRFAPAVQGVDGRRYPNESPWR